MTEQLFQTESYLKEFRATVVASDGTSVVLDRTAFYPGGGGQLWDQGMLSAEGRRYRVIKVSRSGDIVHELNEPGPSRGTAVNGTLDWNRRFALMRTHTALHILYGVIWCDFQAPVTAGNMTFLQARMDFELEQMRARFAEEVEGLANAEIVAARAICVRLPARDQAMKHPDLIRTKVNLLPQGIAQVRVVDIDGMDVRADGGTHVANSREVGSIRIAGHESKGRINKRLRIVVADAGA
jgi:misacylated tRNA(Ala) deacylase